ncbi:MAG TPA: hypothetical protein VIX19_17920, partial [Terriglobales bacterium]
RLSNRCCAAQAGAGVNDDHPISDSCQHRDTDSQRNHHKARGMSSKTTLSGWAAEYSRRRPGLGSAMAAMVVAAAWLYLALNSHGSESNRLLAIGIGDGIGWFMILNA